MRPLDATFSYRGIPQSLRTCAVLCCVSTSRFFRIGRQKNSFSRCELQAMFCCADKGFEQQLRRQVYIIIIIWFDRYHACLHMPLTAV